MEGQNLTAGNVMTTDVTTVHPEDTLADALYLLSQGYFGGLPVVDNDGYVKGILSKTDLIAGVLQKERSPDEMIAGMVYQFIKRKVDSAELDEIKVSQVMTSKVYTAHPDTTIHDVAVLMMRHEINRVPIVDADNKLVGIIARSDLLTVLSQLIN